MEQQLVDPLVLDVHRPLLFLQLLTLRLAKCKCLLYRRVDDVRPQRVDNLVEEVSLWHALVVLAYRVRQVLADLWKLSDNLRVDVLDCKLRPLRDSSRRYVLLQQRLLFVA